MQKKSIIKNYSYNLFYQLLLLITPLVTTPYLSRILGVEGIGEFSYAQSITTYFILLGTLGGSLYGQREIAYNQNNITQRTKIFKEIISLRGITVLISFLLFYIFFLRNNFTMLYFVLGVEIIIAAFDVTWFFQGIEEFKKILLRNTIIKIISIIAIFIFVKDKNDIHMYAICYVLPIFLGHLSIWFYLPQYLKKEKFIKKNIFSHLIPMLLLFLPQLAIEIYTVLDKTMLGSITKDLSEVGYYEQSQKIIKIILRIITAMGIVMLPKISNAFMQKDIQKIDKYIGKSFSFVLLLSFPMIFGLIGISNNFVPWFFGEGYSKVSLLIMMMTPLIFIIGISNIVGVQYLLPTKKQRIYTISVLIGAGVNIILNFILIKQFQSYGAAIATIVAELAVMGYQLFMVRNYLDIKTYFKGVYKYFFLSIFMGIILVTLSTYIKTTIVGTFLLVMIGAVIYISGLLILKDEIIINFMKLVMNKIYSNSKM